MEGGVFFFLLFVFQRLFSQLSTRSCGRKCEREDRNVFFGLHPLSAGKTVLQSSCCASSIVSDYALLFHVKPIWFQRAL